MTKEQTQEAQIAKRVFPINGRLESGLILDMEKALFQMYLEDHSKKANLVIDSWGGDVGAALNGYDIIKSLPFEVDCTIIGDCHSATLTLMAACSKRKATKHSRFLFHAITYNVVYKSTESMEEQIKVKLEQHNTLFGQVLDIQSGEYGITKEEILRMRDIGEKYDVKLTAQEALDKKIIHEIVVKFDFFNPAK